MKINIGVTGLNATDNPGPGIGVIRAIKECKDLDVRIIGLSYDVMEPGIYLHQFTDKVYQIPLPAAGQSVLMERLKYIHSKEKLDLIIPNFDAELFSFIKLSPELSAMGIKTFLPELEQFEERHKYKLNEFGEKHKLNIPKSLTVTRLDDITRATDAFDFPMVVKGKYYEAYIAYTSEQIHTYYHKISAKWGLPIIIQEFIRGIEYNVAALGDGKGNTIGAIPQRKLVLTDKGKGWAGIAVDDPSLVAMTHDIIRKTKWRSGMELELMKDEKDKIYLIEINPRLPAWIYFTAGVGQNLPAALVKLALGHEVKPFTTYAAGKMFIRYSLDHVCDLKEFEKISTTGEL